MKNILLTCLASLVFISGCSTLPSKLKGQSVMVIYVENDYKFKGKYTTDYRLYYTDEKYILIDPEENYDIRTQLDPGIYEFTKLRTIEKSNSKLGKPQEMHLRVELEENKLTLVPTKVVIKMEGNVFGYTQAMEFVEMDEAEQGQVLEFFSKDKNASIWGIN